MFVLSRPRSAIGYLPFWVPHVLIYQVLNRFPLFEPQQLSFSSVDQKIPFTPELLPLYVSYLPFYWWTVARSESDVEFTRFFTSAHLQLLICGWIWLLAPVSMDRSVFYNGPSYNWADAFWRWFDGPNNCFPSLHAANGLLFIEFNLARRAAVLHTVVALGIIVSTVFVKQHYVVDLIAGAMVYVVSRVLLDRAFPQKT